MERIKLLARNEKDSLGQFVVVGGTVPTLYALERVPEHRPRETVDIDLAVRDPKRGRELASKYKSLDVQSLCQEDLNDGQPGVSFLPDVELALAESCEVKLDADVVIRVASPVAFFVLKLNRARRRRYKRGADLYDLLLILEQFGYEEVACMFAEKSELPPVKRAIKALRWLFSSDTGPGFAPLFEEMRIEDDFYAQAQVMAIIKGFLHAIRDLEE
jgi:hypothetical protein